MPYFTVYDLYLVYAFFFLDNCLHNCFFSLLRANLNNCIFIKKYNKCTEIFTEKNDLKII